MTTLLLAALVGCSDYELGNPPGKVELFEGLPIDVDTNDDGIPDTNLDTNGDGVADLHVDLDGDGIADVNVDLDGDLVADLNVDTDFDGEPDINLDLDGDLTPDENLLDEFTISDGSDVDIVFFGDTSGSMEEELTQMGARVAEFTQRLSDAGGNWQLIAVTGDDGCRVDTLYTPTTPDWEGRFANALLTLPNDENTDEQGLLTVARAVENAGPGECNAGLIRPNALLHAIFLSDENDESPGFDGAPDYWRQYVDRVIATKFGVQGLTRFSAITGATPDGCEGSDPGFGYVEAVVGTGGAFLSICDPWEEQLELLAQASVVQNTFPLTVVPVPSSIQVTVNGLVVPDTLWSWNPQTNVITFTFAPDVGDTVVIEYDRA